MDKYVCIHGHFYQPPRENPWLEDVELQDSAYPYHDWNDRITAECYRQNAASRILGVERKIIDIVNNYAKISFNFGPTLLSWLERHAGEVYERVIGADKQSQEIFSGHGAAIAQVYNHLIMPLANTRDKYTQVLWGIRDFEVRFGRKPEGMWLTETAVDLETLEILAGHEIKFTILAPHQAGRIRQIGSKQWQTIQGDAIDTTQPYLCRLPSGRAINLFFYHASTAKEVADGRLLENGEAFAQSLAGIFAEKDERAQLAHIATDGETYGHHYRCGDMALAYCIHHIESNNLAKVTVYGQYLERYPPNYEVEINENTSWSCSHGIERWRGNCGCAFGRHPSGRQQWRAPLREAMDWLRDQMASIYEKGVVQYTPVDPWELRNRYISVISHRTKENVERFISESADRELNYDEKVALLKLLEMQRNALLMYTSCGWFFDDISGIETVQIMQYAARAIQLAKEVGDNDFGPGFKDILEKSSTNVREFADGKEVYEALVEPTNIDLNRVGAHIAVSSLFQEYRDEIDIYCYSANIEAYDRTDAGIQALATGRATVQSSIVLEEHRIDFAVLHFGDYNLAAAVNARMSDGAFSAVQANLKNAFARGDTTEVMRIMNAAFRGNSYSIWHLFKDEQRRILDELLATTWQEIEASFRQIYEHSYVIMQLMRGMHIPLPKAIAGSAEFVLNRDLCRLIQEDEADLERMRAMVDEAERLSLQLDEATVSFETSRKINRLMERLEDSPDNISLLETIETTLGILSGVASQLDLQKAQNILFGINRQTYPAMKKKADSDDSLAKKWIDHFTNLAQYMGVKVE